MTFNDLHAPYFPIDDIKRDRHGVYAVGKCPLCGERLILRNKQDRETFNHDAYSTHLHAKHAANYVERRPSTETVREQRVTLGDRLDPREQSNTSASMRRR